ncbi:MAG: hypothetical protein VZR02_06320 [Lachnospiraceae bacterium]|nr:hypothetical protein [Lachnospiraceae bacterium]
MSEIRRVLYFCFQPIQRKPPCVTEACQLVDMGMEVVMVTSGCDAVTAKILGDKGIPIELLPVVKSRNVVYQKAKNLIMYHRRWPEIKKKWWNDRTVLWIGTEQAAIKQWRYVKDLSPKILNALEFYEEDWYQDGMKRLIPDIDILTGCEPHRIDYMVDWWDLKQRPYLLRNKPYTHPRMRKMAGTTVQTRNAIALMENKKTLVYQGGIVADRDLSVLAKILADADSAYFLVLSGPADDGAIEHLKSIYPRTLYLGNIPAPLHLEITSHADICVAFYKDNCINNRFCAPNKIYEYAGFGLPMLCNNIPGLTTTIGEAGAGVCVDFADSRAVLDAIDEMDRNYDAFSRRSTAFYDETDNSAAMEAIVEEAFALTEG